MMEPFSDIRESCLKIIVFYCNVFRILLVLVTIVISIIIGLYSQDIGTHQLLQSSNIQCVNNDNITINVEQLNTNIAELTAKLIQKTKQYDALNSKYKTLQNEHINVKKSNKQRIEYY